MAAPLIPLGNSDEAFVIGHMYLNYISLCCVLYDIIVELYIYNRFLNNTLCKHYFFVVLSQFLMCSFIITYYNTVDGHLEWAFVGILVFGTLVGYFMLIVSMKVFTLTTNKFTIYGIPTIIYAIVYILELVIGFVTKEPALSGAVMLFGVVGGNLVLAIAFLRFYFKTKQDNDEQMNKILIIYSVGLFIAAPCTVLSGAQILPILLAIPGFSAHLLSTLFLIPIGQTHYFDNGKNDDNDGVDESGAL